MFTYSNDIKRFRPLIRVQAFIDYKKKLGRGQNKKEPIEITKKRRAVIRDWWRLVIWYIRLRKAA